MQGKKQKPPTREGPEQGSQGSQVPTPISIAAALLQEAAARGLSLSCSEGFVDWEAAIAPPPELLARLRTAKAELLALLRGDRCRHCGQPIIWAHPGAVAFADGTGAHLGCYGEAHA